MAALMNDNLVVLRYYSCYVVSEYTAVGFLYVGISYYDIFVCWTWQFIWDHTLWLQKWLLSTPSFKLLSET